MTEWNSATWYAMKARVHINELKIGCLLPPPVLIFEMQKKVAKKNLHHFRSK